MNHLLGIELSNELSDGQLFKGLKATNERPDDETGILHHAPLHRNQDLERPGTGLCTPLTSHPLLREIVEMRG